MKPITAESLYELVQIDDVRVSPDGARVAFVRSAIDRSANETTRTIWVKDLARQPDAPARPFTAGKRDTQPAWTRDGARLGFISARNGEPSVFALEMAGGEGQCIASHANGISAFEWAPDGSRVVFTASVRADERAAEDDQRQQDADPTTAAEPATNAGADAWDKQRAKEQREHDDALRFDPRTVREFPYRTGTSFVADRWMHVYAMDVPASFADADADTARPHRLTDGDANFELPSWTPDGQSLIGVRARYPEHTRIEYWYDLIRLPLNLEQAQREYQTLLSGEYSHHHAHVSPDGKWVAFLRHREDRHEFRNTTLAICPVAGGDVVDLSAALDRSIVDFEWGKDSAHLYFTQNQNGLANLYRVALVDGAVEPLTTDVQEINSFDVDEQGRVVYAASTPGDPSALYLRETDGRVIPLYQPNARFVAEYSVCPVEEVHYTSDEFTIQGWIIVPPGFSQDKQHPLALEIHGGPSGMWGAATRSMWHEFQALANRGYVVFYCNPRGSGGYGEHFLGANCGDWGDGPMRDILAGVDLVTARGSIDTERMVMTGGSYGGYLTAWIVGRDQRFKAAVAQRGVYNLISMRGVTDIPAFNDRETGASPWEDIQRWWRLSPLSLAPNVQTPLLLEHSELDYRVPISQAEELYLALRTFNKTVELIRWPREGHELSRSGEPRHRVERIARIVDWFDRYTKENQPS